MKRISLDTLSLVLLCLSLWSCKREGDEKSNTLPDTKIVLEAINLTGDDRLNSVVQLSWYGTDADGYITGFEISLDETNWTYTTEQDSTFNFELDAGTDTTDINLFVRAIDNDNKKDPTPASLIIPLKNTPPVVTLDEASFPEDTTNLVLTFRWDATDNDGDESIISAQLKLNDGNWNDIDVDKRIISLIATDPTTSGTTNAYIYYNTETSPQSSTIDGFKNGDTNRVYIRVEDLANAISEVDTSEIIFVKRKTSDLIFVSGMNETSTANYQTILNTAYPSYDYVNYMINSNAYQPKFWNPTFRLMLSEYDKLFMLGDGTNITNPINGQIDIMLAYAAEHIQEFSNNNGKSFIINPLRTTNDISSIVSVMPLDSISTSSGTAFIQDNDSLTPTSSSYPVLTANYILPNVAPFYPTADAEVLYNATITPQSGWIGPDEVAALRKNGANTYQVFISVPVTSFGTTTEQIDLFDQILNDDFNW